MPQTIPEPVRRLIRLHLPTMAHLDVLTALIRCSPSSCNAAEVARHSHMDAASVEGYLNALILAGLVTAEGRDDDRQFRFAPLLPTDADAARQLYDLMSRRPVALVRFVYDRDEPPQASLE